MLINEAVHADDGAVAGCPVVELDLAELEAPLPLVDAVASKLLDSTLDGPAIEVVESIVDDAVGTSADFRDQLDVTIVDEARVLRSALGGHDGGGGG